MSDTISIAEEVSEMLKSASVNLFTLQMGVMICFGDVLTIPQTQVLVSILITDAA